MFLLVIPGCEISQKSASLVDVMLTGLESHQISIPLTPKAAPESISWGLLSGLEEVEIHCPTMGAAFLCYSMKFLVFCAPQAGLAFRV